jgi:hypothetical protein
MSYILIGRSSLRSCDCGQRHSYLNQGRELFRRFHRFPESGIMRSACSRVIPKVLVKLGHLRGLIYSSDRGNPMCDRTYIHFMETPPLLVCDPEGKQLYVIGGNYRVTHRGIEG